MNYESHHLSAAIKKARANLGLSQRDLSERSGLPQAQISKFENGTVDIRLSSLVALFRALGLELELVPRQVVPAVQSIVKNITPRSTIDVKLLARAKMALNCVLQQLARLNQSPGKLEYLKEYSHFLERTQISAIHTKSFKRWTKSLERLKTDSFDNKKIELLIKRTEELRNQLEQASDSSIQDPFSRPAYSLD